MAITARTPINSISESERWRLPEGQAAAVEAQAWINEKRPGITARVRANHGIDAGLADVAHHLLEPFEIVAHGGEGPRHVGAQFARAQDTGHLAREYLRVLRHRFVQQEAGFEVVRESLDYLPETQVQAILGDTLHALNQGNAGATLEAHHGAELDQVPAFDAGPPGDRACLTAAGPGGPGLPGLRLEQPITAGPQFFFEVGRVLGGHGAGNGPTGLVQTAILKNSHANQSSKFNVQSSSEYPNTRLPSDSPARIIGISCLGVLLRLVL